MFKNKKLLTVLLFLISVIYILIVKFVDVDSIGPNYSVVGMSTINNYVHNIFGINFLWYDITKYLGILPFFIVGFYAVIGLIQLIKKKKLSSVDKRIVLLGFFYILLGVVYIFFEKVIINYRPVILDGELEASFPSSHTMLAICICGSSLLISKYYFKNSLLRKIFNLGTWLLILLLVVGRFLSGVHWFSDILGGIIISIFLLSLFSFVISDTKFNK